MDLTSPEVDGGLGTSGATLLQTFEGLDRLDDLTRRISGDSLTVLDIDRLLRVLCDEANEAYQLLGGPVGYLSAGTIEVGRRVPPLSAPKARELASNAVLLMPVLGHNHCHSLGSLGSVHAGGQEADWL